MFTQTARYYDVLYSVKDYHAEVEKLIAVIRRHLLSGGNRLLDVACGTGRHLEYLRPHFTVEGLDVAADMLEIARERNPGVVFYQADLRAFDLGQAYDVVTCLFSSIGYAKTPDELARAAGCMARHVTPGGLLIVEPWFTPATWKPGTVHAMLVEQPDLKIARVNTSFADGRLSYFDLHYLIGTPAGTEHFVERHELGLYETEEMRAALAVDRLEVTYDPDGLTGRGLLVARRPLR